MKHWAWLASAECSVGEDEQGQEDGDQRGEDDSNSD